MTLNGTLSGLVAITAPCPTTVPTGAVLIGLLAGMLVKYAVIFFDRRIDDPAGAISVHGVCGVFGTLEAALFHENLFLGRPYDLGAQRLTQAIGIATGFV
jgi:Amt family ammonium transporter